MAEQTGYFHAYNFLKYRIASVLIRADKPQTSKQIAEQLGVSYGKINSALAHYKKMNIGYFRRLPKRVGPNKNMILWKITPGGVRFYANCVVSIRKGQNLNFHKHKMKINANSKDKFMAANKDKDLRITKDQFTKYIGITRDGKEDMGLEVEDVVNDVPVFL